MTKTEQILEVHKANPELSCQEIADEIGCTTRLVRKVINPIRKKEPDNPNKVESQKVAKILLFDIETAPLEVYAWRLWKQTILPHQVMKDWSILSWAAKWLFSDKVMGDCVSPRAANVREDKKLMPDLWGLFEEADIIVAHNGNKFDIPKVNTRFLINGMNPPTPYKTIDTLSVLNRHFSFSSAKMEEVNGALQILQKLPHEGMDMWKKAVNGEHNVAMTALTNMLAYNKQDVLALEDLYLVLRPWIKSHPNVNLYQEYIDEDAPIKCANCGSAELDWNAKYYTPAGRFAAFRCTACGAIGRSRYSDLSADERKALGISVAS